MSGCIALMGMRSVWLARLGHGLPCGYNPSPGRHGRRIRSEGEVLACPGQGARVAGRGIPRVSSVRVESARDRAFAT